MTWSREEEEEEEEEEERDNVQVNLEIIVEHPATIGNKSMGLWKLNTIKLKRKLEDNFKGFVPSPIANLF